MSDLNFPLRLGSQSLHSYVRAHLDQLEYERWCGIPYLTLAEALGTVGFSAVRVRSLQTAVYRARHGTCKKAAKTAAPLGAGPLRSYMGQRLGDRAEIERKFGKLAWPRPPGKRDPLS
jgi:hypothetical protein